jgi:hypothetical protein
MFQTLTVVLTLLTCNTAEAKCWDKENEYIQSAQVKFTERYVKTVGIPEHSDVSQFVAAAIEACRRKGLKRAHLLSASHDPLNESYVSTNITCEYEFGSAT